MTAAQLGECLSYVVSRSGKVLDSCGRVLQEIVPANAPDAARALPLASFEGQPESFFNLAAMVVASGDSIPPSAAAKKRKFHQLASRKPALENKGQRTCVWDDEVGSLEDVARAILRRQKRVFGRKSSRGHAERHRRLVQHLKVGVSQMFILQRWERGSRELPARWASWLLKMLRRTKPPPQALQRFLFTAIVAILPVICCSLVCQTLNILPDSEVLKSVDILCSALEKSWACFSPFQWEILEERIYQCKQVRQKAGTWLERRSKPRNNLPLLETSMPMQSDNQRARKADDPSLSSSSDEYAVYNDEKLSNELVLSEGVNALVRRALRERQILPSFKKNPAPCIDATAVPVSTQCPLSGSRLKVPARGISCTHLTCFDLECYLKENAELAAGIDKQTEATMWRCPYCGSDATWPQIVVDGFILRILKALPGNIPAVLIWPDGRWGAMDTVPVEKKENSSGNDNNHDDYHTGLSRVGTAMSQQQGRNVKPRLDETDESTWDVKDDRSRGSRRLDGDVSGDEASCDRVTSSAGTSSNKSDNERAGGLSHDDAAMKNGAAVDLPAAPSRILPVLLEINLQDLIKSTLKKARSNEAAEASEQGLNVCEGQRGCFKPIVTRVEPFSVSRGYG
ncbi:uncharacterized protein LOC112351103 [Selaginella moellendorffii]|uniref:uncharacterized protein LOC112351103 n=1 Tax=Selaginella moellendorffii TaxID=88036 RepID=UPI000D1C7B15|nr:uncharacterized protein LOC112351103 [Selaginella moellendorffii]|eukprot:XP_024544158.1 uncharacterized protein LOC112351103 [Selaginella moellendorffii]